MSAKEGKSTGTFNSLVLRINSTVDYGLAGISDAYMTMCVTVWRRGRRSKCLSLYTSAVLLVRVLCIINFLFLMFRFHTPTCVISIPGCTSRFFIDVDERAKLNVYIYNCLNLSLSFSISLLICLILSRNLSNVSHCKS